MRIMASTLTRSSVNWATMHLTNRITKGKAMLASDAKVEDAGAPGEIEVTPEMIAAGSYELSMFNSEYESFESGAERILLSMLDMMKIHQSHD
jgi:hypothetical protein